MPGQNRQLAGDRHRGDLMSSLRPNADEESMQRPRRLGRRPRRLDQHCARMAASYLADAPMVSDAQARLAHTRIEPEVAHELPGMVEPVDVADGGHDAGRHRQIDAGDRYEPLDSAVVQSALGDLAIENGKVLAKP